MIDEIIKFLGTLAIPVFGLGVSIALIIAILSGTYNILNNAISELGTKGCTPFPIIFNLTFMISSFLFFFFFIACGQIAYEAFPAKRNWVIIATILLLISAIGIFFVGLYNLDKDPVKHTIAAVITFTALGVGEFIMAILQSGSEKNGIQTTILIITFVVLGTLFAIFRSPILEWAFFGALLYWGFPLVVKIFRCLI